MLNISCLGDQQAMLKPVPTPFGSLVLLPTLKVMQEF